MNIFFRFAILLFIVFVFACYGSAQTTDSAKSANNKQDTIIVAAEPEYPPYSFVNEKAEPEGLAIDLMKESAKAAGLTVEFRIGVWSHIKKELAKGHIDALPLVGRTPEREGIFDFTMPYLSLHGAIFVRKGNTSIKSLEDLKGKEIITNLKGVVSVTRLCSLG